MVRANRGKVFETKGILEIIFFIYLVLTLFFNLMGKIIKVILIGQMLLMKYKLNAEFRVSCRSVNAWILAKTSKIELLHSNYLKVSGLIFNYASKDLQG